MCTHRPSHLAYERRRASAFTRTRTVNHSNRYMTRLPCQRPHENGTLAPSSLAEGNAEQGRPQLGGQAQVRRLDVRDIGRVRGARTLKRISWLRRAVASCQMAGRLPSNSVKALLTAEATGPAPYLALSDLVPAPCPCLYVAPSCASSPTTRRADPRRMEYRTRPRPSGAHTHIGLQAPAAVLETGRQVWESSIMAAIGGAPSHLDCFPGNPSLHLLSCCRADGWLPSSHQPGSKWKPLPLVLASPQAL